MGKRRRVSECRMHKRPKPSSSSSLGGGGGGGGGGSSRTPPGRVPAGTAPSSGGVRQGTGHPGRAAPGLSPSSTPAHSSSRSSGTPSPGLPPATGRAQLPTLGPSQPPPGGGASTPPATPSSSSSGGGGGTAGISTPMANHPPTFLTPRVNPPQPLLQCEKRLWEAQHLLVYMESNCKEQADELWDSGKYHLKIDFNDLKNYHRARSYLICNNYKGNYDNNNEGGEEYYASAMRTFLLEHFKKKSLDGKFPSVEELKLHIEEHGNLSFTRMPASIMRFSDIKHKSKVVKLFAGQKYGLDAIESMDVARQILCKIFDYMLGYHKKGYCWEGNWTVDDWEVINGQYINFLATAVERTGRDKSDKDLHQLANSVLPTFKLNGVLPTFMGHLQDQLLNLPGKPGDSKFTKEIISDLDFFGWFYTYIKFHPAMMRPLARSTLLEGLYFCMDKLDYKKLSYYKDIAELSWHLDWRADFHPPSKAHQVHYDVFWYKRTPCCDNMPHDNTYAGLLGYHRHLVQHTPDNSRTQWLKGAFVQSMKNSDESELMAAHHDETLLPMFIKQLFSSKFMNQSEFSKRFDQYKADWGK